MKNCHQCEELISEFIEGDLNREIKTEMETHLNACEDCATKVNNIQTLRQTLRELPVLKVSPNFETILRARISIENRRGKRYRESLLFPWQVRIPVYGLSLALIILAVVIVYTQVSKQNIYMPKAAINSEWKGGSQPAQQNASPGALTVYSLDREPAINIIPHSPVKSLSRKAGFADANIDSSKLLAQENNLNELRNRVYQTSY